MATLETGDGVVSAGGESRGRGASWRVDKGPAGSTTGGRQGLGLLGQAIPA